MLNLLQRWLMVFLGRYLFGKWKQIVSFSEGNIIVIYLLFSFRNSYVRDPTTIQFLFEVSRSLHDSIDLSTIKEKDNNHSAHLVSRFIHMVMKYCLQIIFLFLQLGQVCEVQNSFTCSNTFLDHNIQVDYGSEVERHLAFLVQCRGAFGSMSEVKVSVLQNMQR